MFFFHLRNMVKVKPLLNRTDAEKSTYLHLKHHLILQEEQNLHSILTRSPLNSGTVTIIGIGNSFTSRISAQLGSVSILAANIVYIITGTFCDKHYTGETQNSVHTSLTQHLYSRQEVDSAPPWSNISSHTLQATWSSQAEVVGSARRGQRNRAEKLWINKLGAVTPRD